MQEKHGARRSYGIQTPGSKGVAGTKRYAMVIDLRKCIGCRSCMVACKSEFGIPLGVWRTWVKEGDKGIYPNTKRIFMPRLCNHCDYPVCVRNCPTQATFKHKDGFDEISVQNLKPGDLIVKANAKDHKDTGHIMLVTSILQNTNNKDEYWVIVIDETADPHSCDTRSNIDSNSIGGIGMGIVKLCAVNGGVNFYWSICSNKVDADASVVVLGRALKQ